MMTASQAYGQMSPPSHGSSQSDLGYGHGQQQRSEGNSGYGQQQRSESYGGYGQQQRSEGNSGYGRQQQRSESYGGYGLQQPPQAAPHQYGRRPPPRQPQGGDIFGGGDAGGPGGSRRRTPRGERMGVDGTSAGAPSDIFGGSGAFGQGGKPKAAVAATSSDMMRGNTQNMPPPQHNQMLNHQQTGARPGRFAANRGASTFSFG